MANNRVRLAEARVLYIDRCTDRGMASATIRTYDRVMHRFIRDVGDMQLQNLSAKHVQDWVYGLRREHRTDQYGRRTNPGCTPSTFNQNLYVLRAFFKWCQGQGYIRLDPTCDIPAMKIAKKARLQVSPHQMLAMLDSAEYPRDRAYIALTLNSGMRQKDLLAIRRGDVDLERGVIQVTISKTGDVDDLPITLDLDRELRRWIVAYESEIGRPLETDDYLVPTTQSPRIATRNKWELVYGPRELKPKKPAPRMEKVIQAALLAIGIQQTKYEGTHTIRRSVARAYFDNVAASGGDVAALRETAQLLHHSNLHTTERYLGTSAEKEKRDRRMKGKPFLSGMIDASNVVELRAVR